MQLEFRLALCTTAHFKCIIKREVVIFLSFTKNKETKCISKQISNNLKRAVALLSKVCRSKISVTLQNFIRTLEIHCKKGWFFHKIFDNTSVRRQKGESQNGCFKKTKHVNVRFSETLTCFLDWPWSTQWRLQF